MGQRKAGSLEEMLMDEQFQKNSMLMVMAAMHSTTLYLLSAPVIPIHHVWLQEWTQWNLCST